jgi:hypothetical protein
VINEHAGQVNFSFVLDKKKNFFCLRSASGKKDLTITHKKLIFILKTFLPMHHSPIIMVGFRECRIMMSLSCVKLMLFCADFLINLIAMQEEGAETQQVNNCCRKQVDRPWFDLTRVWKDQTKVRK